MEGIGRKLQHGKKGKEAAENEKGTNRGCICFANMLDMPAVANKNKKNFSKYRFIHGR